MIIRNSASIGIGYARIIVIFLYMVTNISGLSILGSLPGENPSGDQNSFGSRHHKHGEGLETIIDSFGDGWGSSHAQVPMNDRFPSTPVRGGHHYHGVMHEFLTALDTMQSHYFEIWQGTWPRSIDWTAAVLGTHLSASLMTISATLKYLMPLRSHSEASTLPDEAKWHEDLVNRYFSQLIAFYYGQDHFSLRTQAYDDMLWVVLGWLESIKFINLHSSLHYDNDQSLGKSTGEPHSYSAWYGTQFIPPFAHRARVFWDLASKGWDTALCGGGMLWSPYLAPYKNAITNELFISASISMYLYFPGDDNPSPFTTPTPELPPAEPHDPKYLAAALKAYKWLMTSNMTNTQELFVDGFHIHGWHEDDSNSTKCDQRNEMVYTYNQGVLLSGMRGLWESTGAISFLEDAHFLIESVIAATGWDLSSKSPSSSAWAGLGRSGVLEEICDSGAYCTQNGQVFKSIFFHHLASFCAPLPDKALIPGRTFAADPSLDLMHHEKCAMYGAWIAHNAKAAYETKDENGEYGMWWGRHVEDDIGDIKSHVPAGGFDYENCDANEQSSLPQSYMGAKSTLKRNEMMARDVNDRGRGRTVETQAGGVAVLRAMWEVISMRRSL
ncbi:MAG: hypothetical protein M1824_002531 [Vezdaea acicularis]|nr:MAG: hypothetical protein M1824_002531 [Vezdaea acicularis]